MERAGGLKNRIADRQRKWKSSMADRRRAGIFCALLLIAGGIFVWMNSAVFLRTPFPVHREFQAPVNVFAGRSGSLYVIDDGKKEILLLDGDRRYTGSIKGGGLESDFYYASLICDDKENNLYVADVVYSGQGTKVGKERILRFDRRGKLRKVLFEFAYEEAEMPFQYGRILELSEKDGQLSVLHAENGGIMRYVLDHDGNVLKTTFLETSGDMKSAAWDFTGNRLFTGSRQGEMYLHAIKDGSAVKLETDGARLAWDATAVNGKFFYADLLTGSLYCLDQNGETCVFRGESRIYTVSAGNDGCIYMTDYSGIYRYDGNEAEYFTGYELSRPFLRAAVWAVGALWLICIIAIPAFLLSGVLKRARDRGRTTLIGMVLGASLCIAFMVGSLALQYMLEKNETDTMRELNLFAKLLEKEVDVGKLSGIRSAEEYRSDFFMQVKEPLDRMIQESYDSGLYYYYVLYGAEEETLSGIMDYENTVSVGQPVYEWGDNVYTRAAAEGEEAQVYGDVSAYGTWSFVLKPVYDRRGRVAAVLETGINMDEYERQKTELIVEICVTLAVSVIVVIMLLMEVIFWLSGRSAGEKNANVLETTPLRTMVFLTYTADSLQDAFIVQLCYQLWNPSFPISRETAAGLPVSVQLFMAALFAAVGGRLAGRAGVRKSMLTGMTLQIFGFLACAFSGGYLSLILGKALIGAGMGITAVTANALAAMGNTQEESGRAFSGINAGILGGITAGDGLGSILLSFGGARLLFSVGAALTGLNLTLACKCSNTRPEKNAADREKGGLLRFLTAKPVWSFFLLFLIPFMVMIYYRDYFFPLYARQNGMSEISVGRLFLLCGLIIIYAGPYLGGKLLEKLGSYRAMLLSGALLFLDVAVFMLYPCFEAAAAGVLLLSVIISFAYTCQNAYFSSLPQCREYGEGRAMGIYSMADNAGQTLGPVLFALAVKSGFTAGIRLMGGIFAILLIAYMIMNKRKRKEESGGSHG